MKKLNNKGITLIEAMIALVIMCMGMQGFTSLIKYQVNVTKRITTKLDASTSNANQALAALSGTVKHTAIVYFKPDICTPVDNMWGKYLDSNTVMLYTNAGCTTQLGTLNQSNNSTYFNDMTMTYWIVSSSISGLRAAVIPLP